MLRMLATLAQDRDLTDLDAERLKAQYTAKSPQLSLLCLLTSGPIAWVPSPCTDRQHSLLCVRRGGVPAPAASFFLIGDVNGHQVQSMQMTVAHTQ